MNEVKPDAGIPPLFYCKPVNDKGGPCHAPDCNVRCSCMLQMRRQLHSNYWENCDPSGSFQLYHHLWLLWQTSSIRGRMSHEETRE